MPTSGDFFPDQHSANWIFHYVMPPPPENFSFDLDSLTPPPPPLFKFKAKSNIATTGWELEEDFGLLIMIIKPTLHSIHKFYHQWFHTPTATSFSLQIILSTEQARYPFELCGQSIPSPVYTSTNTIQVRLKTVAQHGVIGFNASYESISPDKCKSLCISSFIFLRRNETPVYMQLEIFAGV